jgi:hypothetical protein
MNRDKWNALFSVRDVGAIEQEPLLPPRRYWLYFKTPESARIASAWFVAQEQMGNAEIVSKAGDPLVTTDNFFVMWNVPPGRLMPWPQTELGFPNIADPQNATKRSEVDKSLPPPSPTFDPFGTAAAGSTSANVLSAVQWGVVGLAAFLGYKLLFDRE